MISKKQLSTDLKVPPAAFLENSLTKQFCREITYFFSISKTDPKTRQQGDDALTYFFKQNFPMHTWAYLFAICVRHNPLTTKEQTCKYAKRRDLTRTKQIIFSCCYRVFNWQIVNKICCFFSTILFWIHTNYNCSRIYLEAVVFKFNNSNLMKPPNWISND